MDDAGSVSGGEGRGELAGDRSRFGDGKAPVRLVSEELGERRAVVIGHGDEAQALVLSDLIDGADVRMVQGRGGLGLATEAGLVLGSHGALVMEKLERHLAAQLHVLGQIDDAHAPAAERPDQPVVRDLTGGERLPGGGTASASGEPKNLVELDEVGRAAPQEAQRSSNSELAAPQEGQRRASTYASSRSSTRLPNASRWRASSFCR